MYLRHSTVNTPLCANRTPTLYELLFGFVEFHSVKIVWNIVFSKYSETLI